MTHTEIADLCSEDMLWHKKAELIAGILKTRSNAAQALDTALTQATKFGRTTTSVAFKTSTGRQGRIIIAFGAEASRVIDGINFTTGAFE